MYFYSRKCILSRPQYVDLMLSGFIPLQSCIPSVHKSSIQGRAADSNSPRDPENQPLQHGPSAQVTRSPGSAAVPFYGSTPSGMSFDGCLHGCSSILWIHPLRYVIWWLFTWLQFQGSFCVCAQPMRDDVTMYRKISNISRTKSQNSNVSRLGLQLSLRNILKPCVKWRMKM